MKHSIEIRPDYDRAGQWCLRLKKKKGHFSLDEIQTALSEYELDIYFILLNCCGEEDDYSEIDGDYVTAYPADAFRQK